MSASCIILASLPSFCQKWLKLVEIWRSSDKNNFAQFFWDTVYYCSKVFCSAEWIIHQVIMTRFAITLYGQCCWPYVVGEQVVSDISVVCSCWSICSLCCESNNTNLLLRLLNDVLRTSILLHIPNIACPTTWRCVLVDQEYNV